MASRLTHRARLGTEARTATNGLDACAPSPAAVPPGEALATYVGIDSVGVVAAPTEALVGADRVWEWISPQTLRLDSAGVAVVSSRSDVAPRIGRYGISERIGLWTVGPVPGQIVLRLPDTEYRDRRNRSCASTEQYDVIDVAGAM